MPDKQSHNYPDVFGFITDTERHNVGVVQVALAARPKVVQAGRPFEVIMLIQSAADVPVDVAVTLQIPDKDAEGKKGRFITGKERLVIGIEPAEVGYVTLPITTLPDTAIGNNYSIGMDITAKPLGKPGRIRHPNGGGNFKPQTLPEEKQAMLEELKKLKFSSHKRSFLRGSALETSIGVLAGKVGTPLRLEPGWVSLWTLENHDDLDLLLAKYREALNIRMIPKLRREALYEPLMQKTVERFRAAGYPLREIEAAAIAKLLTLILEYGNISRTTQDGVDAGIYNIEPRMKEGYIETADSPPLPHWLMDLLRAIARDERITTVPIKAIPHVAYDGLVYDAMINGFMELERATGETLGTEEEITAYATTAVQKLSQKGAVDFSTVYMPLVLGGIIVYDRVLLANEKLLDVLSELKYILDDRAEELSQENDMIFQLANRVVDQLLRKYGSLGNL